MAGAVSSERRLALERIEAVAPALGAACMFLLGNRNRSWVRRRSETVTFEAYEFARLSTTLDVVVPAELSDRVRVGDERMVLPLDVLKKGPLVNFDLTVGDEPASLLQSREVATVTAWMLVAVALNAGEPPPTAEDVADLVDACDADPRRAGEALAALRERRGATHPQMLAEAEIYRDRYVLLVELPVQPQLLVKYARDERLHVTTSYDEQVGWEATALVVDLASVGFGASYHVEAAIPDELRIAAAQLTDAAGIELCPPELMRDRVSMYPREPQHGAAAQLRLWVRTQRDVLLLPAAVLSALSTAALLLIGVLSLAEVIGSSVSGAAAGVVFVAPSIVAGLVLQRPAAPIVRVMLGQARVALTVVAVATVVAAGCMAFGLRDVELGIVWLALAAITLTASGILGTAAARAPSELQA